MFDWFKCFFRKFSYKWKSHEFVEMPIEHEQLTLRECCVATSHNTFIVDWQIFGKASADMIIKVINEGARFIELDIHDDGKHPIITHGTKKCFATTNIDIDDAFFEIARYAWLDCDYPLFISLEICTDNKDALIELNSKIQYYFYDNLFNKPCYPNTRLSELKKKVVFIGTRTWTVLDQTVLNFFYSPFWTKTSISNVKEDKFGIQLTMVWPNNVFASSNYNTAPVLKRGVQFAALNWQTNDKYMIEYRKHFKKYPIVPLEN